METVLIGVLVVMILIFPLVGWWFLRRMNQAAPKAPEVKEPDNGMLMMQNQLNEITRMMDKRLGETSTVIEGQFARSAAIIRDVTERLTKLDETNKQVVGFADQLKSFENILKNPKQRGILGEYMLET